MMLRDVKSNYCFQNIAVGTFLEINNNFEKSKRQK
jgi:hypothetical protein